MAIDLYSSVPDSGKSLPVIYRAIDTLLEHTDVTSNFPVDMSYFKKCKRGRSFYIPTDKITVEFLFALVRWNHVRKGRKVKRARAVIIIDETEIKFSSCMFSSSDRMDWIFFFANHRHFSYDFWLVAQFDQMIDRQIRNSIQTEFRYRAIIGFGIGGKLTSFLFDGLFCAVPYDHVSRIKFLLPQFYRLYKRKAKVHDTMHMSDSMTTTGRLEGGKKNAVSAKK